MCIDRFNKIPVDQSRRLAVIMRLSNVMTVLLNLWEEMREPSENEDPLFSKQPYSSSTWEVCESWCCAVMNSRLLAHPAESISLSRDLASKAPSPAPAPLLHLNSVLALTRKSPTVSLSSVDQRRLRYRRSSFSQLFSHGSPSYTGDHASLKAICWTSLSPFWLPLYYFFFFCPSPVLLLW